MSDPDSSTFGEADLRLGDSLVVLDEVADETVRLVVSSPPYNIGKSYERTQLTAEEYNALHSSIAKKLVAKLVPGGSVCWQVGNHVRNGELFPLDLTFYSIFQQLGLKLRNRVIWRFNFGLNADRRFSGRYETLLWFTKGDEYHFNVDPVRVPQLYPGKRHSAKKGAKAGLPSGNPGGKNPSDYWEFDARKHFEEEAIWDIPNVKALHPEKTDHTCQFPVELVERCVLALTQPGELVLDPFVGVGSSVIAAIKHGRNAIGIEKEQQFIDIASDRVSDLKGGVLPLRPLGKPVRRPRPTERVAQVPEEWLTYPKVGESDGHPNGEGDEQKAQSEGKEEAKAERVGNRV